METIDYLRFIGSLSLVVGLILGASWAIRRYGPQHLGGISGPKRRLEVMESLTLDAKHRLVLVRQDDQEHLVILGGTAAITPCRPKPQKLEDPLG